MLNLKLRKKRPNPSAGYRIFPASISETVMLSSDEKVLSIPNKTERTDTHTIAAISIAIINFFTLKFFIFPFSFVMFFASRKQFGKIGVLAGFRLFLAGIETEMQTKANGKHNAAKNHLYRRFYSPDRPLFIRILLLQPIRTRGVVGRSFTFSLIGQRLSPPPTRLREFPPHRAGLRFPRFSLLSPHTIPQLRRPLPNLPRLLPHILRRACPQP